MKGTGLLIQYNNDIISSTETKTTTTTTNWRLSKIRSGERDKRGPILPFFRTDERGNLGHPPSFLFSETGACPLDVVSLGFVQTHD